MHKILVTEPDNYCEECKSILAGLGSVTYRRTERAELLRIIAEYDVLIVGVVTVVDRELLDSADKLRVIGSPTTGLDHIDLEYAAEKGIEVISLKGERAFLESIHATVEHTWALLFSLIRRIPWVFNDVCKGVWERERYIGTELAGKTLGVIGLGRIGSKIIKQAAAFGMEVIAHDPYVKSGEVKMAALDNLLEVSDIILVLVSLTAETEGLLNTHSFELMRKKPVIVNTSRGKVINEVALLDALDKGIIAGAALDVLSSEVTSSNPSLDNPLIEYARNHDNLIITPHIGGATYESMHATQVFIARKIEKRLGLAG